ncbi:MAG: multidrug ABC transporter ATP-binding protein, partial [Rhizobiaceae bacterium]
WLVVEKLRESGVTIILTTHYIEEAEEIADRVGVIDGGSLLLLEEKAKLMTKLGRKQLRLELAAPISALPESLESYNLTLSDDRTTLIHDYQGEEAQDSIASLLATLARENIHFRDLSTRQSSLEDIFVALVAEKAGERA